jgi:hypothetical protein
MTQKSKKISAELLDADGFELGQSLIFRKLVRILRRY